MSDPLELLVDLQLGGVRQGPGSEAATRRAIELAGLRGRADLAVADLGCGTGASTLVLAGQLDATITAVDLVPAFLARLDEEALYPALESGHQDNVLLTPHSAGATQEPRGRGLVNVAENIRRFRSGELLRNVAAFDRGF